MFWMNKGPNIVMTIEKAGMDGSSRASLVIVTAQLPRGLTLDVAARRLYWLSDFKKVGTGLINSSRLFLIGSFKKDKGTIKLSKFSMHIRADVLLHKRIF